MLVDIHLGDSDSAFFLHVSNLGKSFARNVQIQFEPQILLFLGKHNETTDRLLYAGLGPDQTRKHFVDFAVRALSGDRPRCYTVTAEWDCPVSGRRREVFTIDLDSWAYHVKTEYTPLNVAARDTLHTITPTATTPQS